MEVMVYRKPDSVEASSNPYAGGYQGLRGHTVEEASADVQSDLQPDVFYPRITEEEWETWGHWLPTLLTFDRKAWRFPADIQNALKQLEAPPEVLEELHWADTLELFDTYEVRTPERRDIRDPLLVGRCGSQRYRLALWGESLRPLDEIRSLVQRSLVLRERATKWRRWCLMGGALGGFVFGLLTGNQATFEGNPFTAAFLFALLGLFFTAIPLLANTPENRQHHFLDRYRR